MVVKQSAPLPSRSRWGNLSRSPIVSPATNRFLILELSSKGSAGRLSDWRNGEFTL